MVRSSRLSGAKPIFLDREQRENLAALRHVGNAAAGAFGWPQRGDIVAFPGDGAPRNRVLAGERIKEARLADTVAAEHAGDLAGLGLERNGTQGLRGAVVQIDGVDFEHVV
jgi:hypothetical protein